MTPTPLSNYLLGYIVLESRKRPVFPLLPHLEESQHIEGATGGNGTVVCQATNKHTFFQPELGKKVLFFSSSAGYDDYDRAKSIMGLYVSLRQSKDEDSKALQVAESLFPHLLPNSLVFLDQETPYGAATILTNGVELRLIGVYTQDFALLAITNIQNFEERLNIEYPSVFWTHRFETRDMAYLLLFTKRVCARWFRWKSQENLSSTAARFAALEKLLFKGTV